MTSILPVDSLLHRDRPVDVNAPEYQQVFARLQGNILKSHGRDFAVSIFVESQVEGAALRRLIAVLARRYVTSTQRQLRDAAARRQGTTDRLFGNLFLARGAYYKLRLASLLDDGFVDVPPSMEHCGSAPRVSFREGMLAAAETLNDRLDDFVEPLGRAYQRDAIDMMLLLACDDAEALARTVRRAIDYIERDRAGVVVAVEVGRIRRDSEGRPIENFGYVDGRSQPLFLATDFEGLGSDGRVHPTRTRERRPSGRSSLVDRWNPFAPLSLALLKDPGTRDPMAYGSYYVFRKLEQDVDGFRDAVVRLAVALGLGPDEWQRAGAMIVGRFQDGTPLTLSDRPLGGVDPENNFRYDAEYAQGAPIPGAFGDRLGLRCPFQAHIRKVNPRQRNFDLGESEDVVAERELCARAHRIVRRGITYGLNGHGADALERLTGQPSHGVGLLFACFQSSIANQFAFIHKEWANSIRFPVDGGARTPTGVDPIVGQPHPVQRTPYSWRRTYGGAWNEQDPEADEPRNVATGLMLSTSHPTPHTLNSFVSFRGGEFFFAPSLPFLLGDGA